jgi:hypothetical protein
MKTPKRDRLKTCTAIIADMVHSRDFAADARRRLQRRLQAVLYDWNHAYTGSVLSEFTITTGDEFQGLLKKPNVLPEMIRSLETSMPEVEFRWGIGFGELFTDLTPTAVGMDGPAWHNAREAIIRAKNDHQPGGVFVGFGNDDAALSALARFLHHHFHSMTTKQRQIADLLQQDITVKDIASQLQIEATNVSRQKKTIRWPMLQEGKTAITSILERFDVSLDWTLP